MFRKYLPALLVILVLATSVHAEDGCCGKKPADGHTKAAFALSIIAVAGALTYMFHVMATDWALEKTMYKLTRGMTALTLMNPVHHLREWHRTYGPRLAARRASRRPTRVSRHTQTVRAMTSSDESDVSTDSDEEIMREPAFLAETGPSDVRRFDVTEEEFDASRQAARRALVKAREAEVAEKNRRREELVQRYRQKWEEEKHKAQEIGYTPGRIAPIFQATPSMNFQQFKEHFPRQAARYNAVRMGIDRAVRNGEIPDPPPDVASGFYGTPGETAVQFAFDRAMTYYRDKLDDYTIQAAVKARKKMLIDYQKRAFYYNKLAGGAAIPVQPPGVNDPGWGKTGSAEAISNWRGAMDKWFQDMEEWRKTPAEGAVGGAEVVPQWMPHEDVSELALRMEGLGLGTIRPQRVEKRRVHQTPTELVEETEIIEAEAQSALRSRGVPYTYEEAKRAFGRPLTVLEVLDWQKKGILEKK